MKNLHHTLNSPHNCLNCCVGFQCHCCPKGDNVKIDMDLFVKLHQPEKYKKWMEKQEMGRHPEDDQGKLCPASRSVVF